MIFRTTNLLSLAAMAAAAAVFTACNESPSEPRAVTSAEARADLQAMAAKVKYFAPQNPGARMDMGGDAERGAAKAGADQDPGSECDLEATQYDSWNTGISATGDVTVQYDTTVSYTSAGQPICDFEDVTAYQVTSSRSENAMLESHFKNRMDVPADFSVGEIRLTGSGAVHYKDGYLITVTSMNIVIDLGQGIVKTYVMDLALEKGYTAVMQLAPGFDLLSEEERSPNEVALRGPISKDGTVVGYLEVMGDDRVIIRDAGNAIIEAHG